MCSSLHCHRDYVFNPLILQRQYVYNFLCTYNNSIHVCFKNSAMDHICIQLCQVSPYLDAHNRFAMQNAWNLKVGLVECSRDALVRRRIIAIAIFVPNSIFPLPRKSWDQLLQTTIMELLFEYTGLKTDADDGQDHIFAYVIIYP